MVVGDSEEDDNYETTIGRDEDGWHRQGTAVSRRLPALGASISQRDPTWRMLLQSTLS